MKSVKIASIMAIAAASLLVVYIGAGASWQRTNVAQQVDWPTVLKADAAMVDYFLQIDGVEGESTAQNHEGQIDVLAWSWGASNTGLTTTGGTTRPDFQDFSFQMAMSKASPILFLKCASGEHINGAVLTARRAGGEQPEYLTIKFSDVIVSSYQTDGKGDTPIETLTLKFAKIEIEYKPQNSDGSLGAAVTAEWDLSRASRKA